MKLQETNINNIDINSSIYNKALLKIKEKERKAEYIHKCVEANICPVCGKPLNNKTINIDKDYKENYLVCSNDVEHFIILINKGYVLPFEKD